MFDVDPGRYFAERLRRLHPLSQPPTQAELESVCSERGVPIVPVPGLQVPGVYVNWPLPAIFLQPGAAPRVLAHELFHHITSENLQHGIVCCYPDGDPDAEEEANAERFVRVLFGDEE
jgi:hypothetical protein